MTVDRSSPAYARTAASLLEAARARNVQAVQRARAKLNAQLDRALAVLHPPEAPPSDRARAAMLASVDLDPTGGTWQARVSWLTRREPTIVGTFTLSALHAIAQNVPATVDRWCLARNHAVMHDLPAPHELPKSHRTALRRALGSPCAGCAAVMDAHDAQTSRPSASTGSTASASGPAGASSTPRSLPAAGITAGAGGSTTRLPALGRAALDLLARAPEPMRTAVLTELLTELQTPHRGTGRCNCLRCKDARVSRR